jgi:uncharacterized protein YodC (DUF2158 family)
MFRKHDVVESKIGGLAFVREDQGGSDQVVCISVSDEGETHSNKWPAAALTRISDVPEAPTDLKVGDSVHLAIADREMIVSEIDTAGESAICQWIDKGRQRRKRYPVAWLRREATH